MKLQDRIEGLFATESRDFGEEYFAAFDQLKAALKEGAIRAAQPDAASPTGWRGAEVPPGMRNLPRLICGEPLHEA